MVKIIAEAGVNHNGDLQTAYRLVEAAAEAGADFIKFQTFEPTMLVAGHVQVSRYQKTAVPTTDTQLNLLNSLELGQSEFQQIKKCCISNEIEFMTTAFDDNSLDFVIEKLRPRILKISSGDLTNTPFLLRHARANLKIILSTGMGNISDIERALSVIGYGLHYGNKPVENPSAFDKALSSPAVREVLREKITLLHCTTSYPAKPESINLACLETLKKAFPVDVGFSDHSEGLHIPIAAVALGAKIVEKHFTLDKKMQGPDHAMSIEPDELTELVKAVRDTKKAIGSSIKAILPEEYEHIHKARKVLVAIRNIAVGEIFDTDNVRAMRYGEGMDPHKFWDIVGKASLRQYKVGEVIEL